MIKFFDDLLRDKKEKLHCEAALHKHRRFRNADGSISLSGKN